MCDVHVPTNFKLNKVSSPPWSGLY